MIRLDLLPDYIRERKKIKTFLLVFLVLIIVELAIFGLLMKQGNSALAAKEDELASLAGPKAQADAAKAELERVKAQIQPYEVRVTYANDLMDYNRKWQEAIERIFPYVSSDAVVKRLDCDGTQISIEGYAKSVRHMARFYFNFIRCPAVTNTTLAGSSNAEIVETGDMLNNAMVNGELETIAFRFTASLKEPLKKPTAPGAAAAAAPGMAGPGMAGPGMAGPGPGGMGPGMPTPPGGGGASPAPSGGGSSKDSADLGLEE